MLKPSPSSTKNLLQILLITLCVGLIVLLGIQWVRETRLEERVKELGATIQSKAEIASTQQMELGQAQQEIQRMDALRNELRLTLKTNSEALNAVSRKLQVLTNELTTWQKQSEVYRDALAKANASIKQQNDDIRQLNEDIKKVATQRDDLITRYNKLAGDHNELVKKWNKQQEELKRAAATPAYPPWK